MSGKGFVGVPRRGIAGNPVRRPFGFGALEDDEVEEVSQSPADGFPRIYKPTPPPSSWRF